MNSVFTKLEDVSRSLRAALGNDISYRMVCTRALLASGVNLLSPRPDQVVDRVSIGKVVAVLTQMGYKL